jgi:hypothetical protein
MRDSRVRVSRRGGEETLELEEERQWDERRWGESQ